MVHSLTCKDSRPIPADHLYLNLEPRGSGEGANSAQVSATPSSTAPVNIAMSASSGALNFSWSSDHTGWHLQVQINGLGGNWSDVVGAAQTDSVLLPADSNNAAFLPPDLSVSR